VRVTGNVLIMLLLVSPCFAFCIGALRVAGRELLSRFREMSYCGLFNEYILVLVKVG
jgi:hypothetical protein